MADFKSLIQSIHGGAQGVLAADQDQHIIITSTRKFELPQDFETTIAYEGDINSQIVTFVCPMFSEGHDLSKCAEKRLRWYNESSKNEGNSKLQSEINGTSLLLRWEAPPEAFTQSGVLQIAISFYDRNEQGKVVFSWNTPAFSQLQVGATLDKVGSQINHESFDSYEPAKDEILVIDSSTRQIIAPNGYNHILCNYGDVGTSVVYFQIKRYIRGIDVLGADTELAIYWKLQDMANVDRNIDSQDRRLYAVEIDGRDSEGLINIVWKPSKAITANSLFYNGQITIQLEIVQGEKVWRTNAYNRLAIGEGQFHIGTGDLPVEDSNMSNYIVDGAVITDDKKTETIAGLVKLRTCTATKPIFVHQNEIVIENDSNGNYVGAKIGTQPNGQDSRQAPYVAYAPSLTILLDGGNALEE